MENVLMLDMEGVFIASTLPPAKRRVTLDFSVHYLNDYGIRNHAKIFLYELLPLFDEKYLNTCIKEDRAMEIMRQVFSIEDINYYNWNRRLGKTSNYHRFSGKRIIHIEDCNLDCNEAKYCLSLGHEYIAIKGWYPYHSWGEDFKNYRRDDDELLRVIKEVKKII